MADMDTYPTVLTIGEAAARLRVSVATVRRWNDAGKLAGFRTPGGQRRFHSEDIQALTTTEDGAA